MIAVVGWLPCVVATTSVLPVLDGVHQGHAALIAETARLAAVFQGPAVALTFDPHPTKVVAPSRAPRLLSTPEQRFALMRQEGIVRGVRGVVRRGVRARNNDSANDRKGKGIRQALVTS